jgi:hypothetical protein
VHVGKRSNWLGIAISVTALDAGVTTYYGSVVWKAFSVVIWTKLLLVLLAAIWAITLLHVWVYACSQLRQANRGRQVVVSVPMNNLSTELVEEIDV